MSQPVPEPHFPLTILVDADSIEWSHLIGVLEHTLTPDELPVHLGEKLMSILSRIASQGQAKFVLSNRSVNDVPKHVVEILELTAWWLEWNRRRKNAHGYFECTHCRKHIAVKTQSAKADTTIYSCPDNTCPTWDMLSKVTGKPILRVVESVESA